MSKELNQTETTGDNKNQKPLETQRIARLEPELPSDDYGIRIEHDEINCGEIR